ncbi:MAG: AAA family ATPase [Methanobrevibacter sp.]|jgi:thymidine kinase|nr:AAA family ATPase [Candidatus Methanoflexus mossambicus]
MVQHLSIRVPWHDNDWKGTFCKNPEKNHACRSLRNIALNKDDDKEIENAGETITCKSDFIPPCIMESGAFMSNHPICSTIEHPYSIPYKNDKFHAQKEKYFGHLKKKEIEISPYTFIGTPFKWTLKKDSWGGNIPHDIFFTKYDKTKEVAVTYSNTWINNGDNQKDIFKYFYENVESEKSMVVAYAKTVPFVESSGRVIIGIGTILSIGEQSPYEHIENTPKEAMKSYPWERQLGHSIRENRENGFLFPFKEIRKYINEHPSENQEELINKLVVIAPEEYFEEFSYKTEHLSHDALIQILNKTITVLNNYKNFGIKWGSGADWDECIQWCNEKLEGVWKDRGAYPGLGAVLSALKIPFGFDIAKELKKHFSDEEIWKKLPQALENLIDFLPTNIKGIVDDKRFTENKIKAFQKKCEKNGILFEIMSRFTLSLNQARLILDKEEIKKDLSYASFRDIYKKDLSNEIIQNPYILYEETRFLEPKYQFGIGQIDLALFQEDSINISFPKIPIPRPVKDPDDSRRLRAIITSILELKSMQGHTWELVSELIREVREFRSDVENMPIDIDDTTLEMFENEFDEIFSKEKIIIDTGEEKQENNVYQLNRYVKIGDLVHEFIEERVLEKINDIDNAFDWEKLLDEVLENEEQSEEEYEKRARDEKINAIKKMAHSKIFVLTGGAGTGKTTTLVALCKNRTIQSEGILILTPTGKSRVVLEQKLRNQGIRPEAKTIFQYLLKTNHCNYKTMSYYLSGNTDDETPGTIIIDESSMITEEMFGALIEAVKNVKRIIFVGDPNQLPPIGSGKPFLELNNFLKENYLEEKEPLYSKQLHTPNRQKGKIRLDEELSKYFTEDQVKECDVDTIFDRINKDSTNIVFKQFNETSELNNLLFETITEISNLDCVYGKNNKGMVNTEDVKGFIFSIGGYPSNGHVNFKDAEMADYWQILTPYKNDDEYGSISINHEVQQKYYKEKNNFGKYKKRFTANPLGPESIQFGEKVINIHNKNIKGYPENEACEDYIANGEVGIVVNLRPPKKPNKFHNVMFSSQKGYTYGYDSKSGENDVDLELAYALTVHKSQGSGFKATIVIINEPENGPSSFVSRELIYTALTRQYEKIYILYNKEPWKLKEYRKFSELGSRKTNIYNNEFKNNEDGIIHDENYIHITSTGENVLSKSEVIIANLLHSAGIKYIYEKKLKNLKDDSKDYRKPDFTIITPNGTEVYWEHCGMMGVSDYRQGWEEKKEVYLKNGISEEKGNLIVTMDNLSGGIDSQEIKEIINEKLKIKNNENENETKEKDDFGKMIYPLVVSYDLMDREDNIHKKIDNFFKLFEFITAFNAITSISAIPRELFTKSDIIKNNKDFEKVSFGNWLGLLRALGKFYHSYKSQNKENSEVEFPFGIDFYKNISNKKNTNRLNEIVELRNKKAHGNLREEIIIDKLDFFENEIYSIFEQFNGLQLIYIKKMDWGENKEFKYDAKLLNGRDRVFETIELNTDYKLKLNRLYLYKHDTEEFLELKNELIKFIHCPECSNWSIFIYNKFTKNKAIYNSYQSEDHQHTENEIKFEDILY